MQPQNYSPSLQKASQLHYHYHYYYPSDVRNSSSQEWKQKLSRSFTSQAKKGENLLSTPKAQRIAKLNTQGDECQQNERDKFLQMSQITRTKKPNITLLKESQEEYIRAKARSEAEQQLQQCQEELEHEQNSIFSERKKSVGTGIQFQNSNQDIIAHYEAELRKFRSEVERLKMVEQECVYLRNEFYNHYEERCNNDR